MSPDDARRLALARELMDEFARDTGVDGDAPPRRYLWTDAFAVCNLLGLYRRTGDPGQLERAQALVEQVHRVLGRHRSDDPRRGWISGLGEAEGARRPTAGGLRIGKELPERGPGEPFEPRLEWDRDGQYLHYLTQWIHALRRVAEETGRADCRRWAIDLAAAAYSGFTVAGPRGRLQRTVWKMSIALDRALVPSMGQHDPLDLWLAMLELDAGAAEPVFGTELDALESLAAETGWETGDALGVGALLVAVARLARLTARGEVVERDMLERLTAAARISLADYERGDPLMLPAASRLPFRELGLAIGLHAVARIAAAPELGPVRPALDELARHLPLARHIDEMWSDPARRAGPTWIAHRDINAVMLATSLVPEGYLGSDYGSESVASGPVGTGA